jgi:hypothetical protein
MRQITIREVLNGYLVQVDCQELVFPDFDTLLKELVAYHTDPRGVEEHYTKMMAEKADRLQPAEPEPSEAPDRDPRAYTTGVLAARERIRR